MVPASHLVLQSETKIHERHVEKYCSWSLRFNFSRQLRNIDGWTVTAVSRLVVPSLESRALFEDEGTAILQNVCNRVNCRHSLTELSSVALLREHQSPPSVWESYQNFEVSVGKTIFSNVKSGGVDIYPWNLQGKFIHSFSILPDDRSKASSKTMPPHSAIQSLLLQMRISSPVLKVIQ